MAVVHVVALLVSGALAYLLCKVAAYLFWFLPTWKALKTLPQAPGGGLLGWTGMLDDPKHLPHGMHKAADELGGIFSFRTLHVLGVIVTDPALAQKVLQTLDLPKDPRLYSVISTLLSPGGKNHSLLSHPTHDGLWKAVRKGTAPAFSPKHIRAEFSHVVALSEQICSILAAAGPDPYVDMVNLLQRESMDVIGRLGFSCDFGALRGFKLQKQKQGAGAGDGSADFDPDDVLQILQAGADELTKRFSNPLRYPLRHLLPDGRRGERCLDAVHAVNWRLMKDVRARGEPAPDDMSIAAHLLRIRDPETGAPLSDEQLAAEIGVFFFAGMETTANTMSWVLYFVATHPEVEAKLCAELDALGLLATPSRPSPRSLVYEDLSKLSYLGCVIKEAMRLVPVVGGGALRITDRPLELGGYTIPEGVPIGIPFHAMMNSVHLWDRPDEFLPERWQDPGMEYWRGSLTNNPSGKEGSAAPGSASNAGFAAAGKAGDQGLLENEDEELKEVRLPRRFIPFSIGVRNCIGQNLAKMNYTATLAVLLSNFHFELPAKLRGLGALWDLQCYRTTTQPANGLPMRAIPRA